jgi:hypothetical protein
MATLGRETLSSRLTSTLQVGPMVLWLVDAYLLVWLILHRFPGLRGLGGNGVMPTLHRLLFVLLLLPFVLLPALSWWAIGLRRVTTDGTRLQVTLGSRTEVTIPLAEVVEVRERRVAELCAVTLRFGGRTPAGRSVRFLAPVRRRLERGEPHPIVIMLRAMVHAARSEGGA